jgi:hypothetical protein
MCTNVNEKQTKPNNGGMSKQTREKVHEKFDQLMYK